jgi:glutathione S-transferase
MLELYHSINSVCAQKVRIALEEKGLEARDHLMTLRGDQYEPAYLKLNPNGVVPTLIHDGEPITESSLILYYIDDAFPEAPLMPNSSSIDTLDVSAEGGGGIEPAESSDPGRWQVARCNGHSRSREALMG